MIAHVRTNRDGTTIDCNGGEITFPAPATEGVRFALSNSKFPVFELPDGLDDAGKLTLVRRLIRDGLLMVPQLEGVRCP